MRTLEEIAARFWAGYGNARDEFDRCMAEAHALGRSEMEAEVAKLRAEGEERERALREALEGTWQALSPEGKCWCCYAQIVHPPDDPQDAITLEPNGHTRECNAARAALRPHKEEP